MVKIDAHQHFWKYNKEDFGWITTEMSAIQNDFLPGDIKPLLDENDIDGCVSVQTHQSEAENNFLLSCTEQHSFIKGVVGWVDLLKDDVEDKLSALQAFKKFKGVRHILQGEKNRALMLTTAFKNGIKKLKNFDFTYDILIYPDQLQYTLEFVKLFPEQKFVIDHLAKPYIKKGDIKQWQKDIESFRSIENVYCKVSGMVTEADWQNHSQETFEPYLDVISETFGAKRIIYGSDWPVCLVAAESYNKIIEIAINYFASFSEDETDNIFGMNAVRFYNLDQ